MDKTNGKTSEFFVNFKNNKKLKRSLLVTIVVSGVCVYFIFSLVLGGSTDRFGFPVKKKINRVEVIKNPPQPFFDDAFVVELDDDFSIEYGEDDNDIFGRISRVELDEDDNIYLLDSKRCAIFKFNSSGKYLGKVGNGNGVGPGEFRRPRDLFVREPYVYVLDGFFIHVFKNAGDKKDQLNYEAQIKLDREAFDFWVNRQDEIIYSYVTYEGNSKLKVIGGYSPEDQKARIIKRFPDGQKVNIVANGKNISFHLSHIYTPQLCFERLNESGCVFGHSSAYGLTVLTNSERPMRIEKEEEPRQILAEEKERIYNWYAPYYEKKWPSGVFRKALQFPDHRPFFRDLIADDQQRIYVARLERKDDMHCFDVFDKEGNYIYKIQLPFIPEAIRDGNIYYIYRDRESDETSVKRARVKNWRDLKVTEGAFYPR
jgi:hypothetical protein